LSFIVSVIKVFIKIHYITNIYILQ